MVILTNVSGLAGIDAFTAHRLRPSALLTAEARPVLLSQNSLIQTRFDLQLLLQVYRRKY